MSGKTSVGRWLTIVSLCLVWPGVIAAQGNFEIQVYGSDTLEPGKTMVELHSNTAIRGTTTREEGVFPTQHAVHETIEITHGFTPWFETGFYIFTGVSSLRRAGSGWGTISVHGCASQRVGMCRWA